MEPSPVTFELKHVGINMPDAQAAEELTQQLCTIFDLQPKEMPTSYFAGKPFEVMKRMGRGRLGHIALGVDDVEAAMDYLAGKGIRFVEETARRNEAGKVTFIYLEGDFAGFEIHLVTK